eukprot:8006422-Pyramimonas_sp.AAC.1
MALHLANMSPSKTALAWNTYLIALIPYPSHYSLPDTVHERTLRAHLRVALGLASASWIPDNILTGLGIRFQVPGCPKCPVATSRAIAARAHVLDDLWGPPQSRHKAGRRWKKLVKWAREFPPRREPLRPGSKVLTDSRAADLINRA